jgi:hypothetical protein
VNLIINSYPISFKPDLDNGFWMQEKIIIHDTKGFLDKAGIMRIIQYLYDEGFILDRRTPYELVRAEGIEPPTSTV